MYGIYTYDLYIYIYTHTHQVMNKRKKKERRDNKIYLISTPNILSLPFLHLERSTDKRQHLLISTLRSIDIHNY